MNLFSTFKNIYTKISTLGYSKNLSSYTKKRVLVFNQLNFAAFLFSIVRLIYIFIKTPNYFSFETLGSNSCLTGMFLLLILMMKKQYFTLATISSFLIVPPLFALVTWVSKDEGMSMFVVNYMMFCFFFLHRVSNSLIAFTYCFIVFLVVHFKLESDVTMTDFGTPNFNLTVFNYVVAFVMFFATLSLIKYQVWMYEKSIKSKTRALEETTIEIEAKNDTLKMQSENLAIKTQELSGLNRVKTKLFSVISHDLRTSIYSFKNILESYRLGYITKEELLAELPDLSIEVDSCTELMDNLLSWGKDQFKERSILAENISIRPLIDIVFKQLSVRIDKKKLLVLNNISNHTHVFADKQMIQIVIRNLVSNAIKFTPNGGKISISSTEENGFIKIAVTDTGYGVSEETVEKILSGNSFSTQGTNAEVGTGLGLIICKDFIQENNGLLYVEKNEVEGSTFTVSLPNNMPKN
jgi:two-component system, sensor histidine kinase and response regulator